MNKPHSLFYNNVEENETNKVAIATIKAFSDKNPKQQIYLLTSPLGEKYKYDYEKEAIVILSPEHKIIFLNLKDDKDAFEEYYDEFIEDLGYISDKFEYKDHIGRPREWKRNITITEDYTENLDIQNLFEKNKLEESLYRRGELLISLLIGSINDIEKVGVETPETLLDKVKKNIILFDGDQTRFIYEKFENKTVSIQGLSGTGKTELLLHKLKELYLADDNNKIFFTCHNIALSNSLKNRIPRFFNFMKVNKQIEWNSRLWMDRAWGSGGNRNSGLYTYLCGFYDIPFRRWNSLIDYKNIFSQVLEYIDKIPKEKFVPAFDYILVDEKQDFPEVFFNVCERVTKNKVYVAGDIFQDIFGTVTESSLDVDIVLNRCYRTDPRTLMFAHAIGLGLFEKTKLRWFKDSIWKNIGYEVTKFENREVHLAREPIRRFEDLDLDGFSSMEIIKSKQIDQVIDVIEKIQKEHTSFKPGDIGIILLDDKKDIFEYMDNLADSISTTFGFKVNRGYESKTLIDDTVYITNPNNVKGLEFPFVICITDEILNSYRYRNVLYTMLTRSFIKSYLFVSNTNNLDVQEDGLSIINKNRYIKTIEPTGEEKIRMKEKLDDFKMKTVLSYKEFLDDIFHAIGINDATLQKKLIQVLDKTDIEKFDREKTTKFIQINKEFYEE